MNDKGKIPIPGSPTWSFTVYQYDAAVRFPHWFAILVSGTVAVLSWIPYRFSLRTLLIATTLVAVVLGIVVAAR